MSTSPQKATVIGGGSFGTAIANILAENDFIVNQWMRNEQTILDVNNEHENKQYLPGVNLHKNIHATSDLAAAIDGAVVVFYAIPSKSFREIVERTKDMVKQHRIMIPLIMKI